MAGQPASFVDHYAVLECSPDTLFSELKRVYFEKLRVYHPDKRPGSAGQEGRKVTQALNEAWAVLREPAKRESYDALWRKEREPKQPEVEVEEEAKAEASEQPSAERSERQEGQAAEKPRAEPPEQQAESAPPSEQRAEELRREGNELYKAAVALVKQHGAGNLFGAMMSLQKYEAAIEKYSLGIELNPHSHLLQNNRALCYAALKDWQKCRLDAVRVTMLKPDFMKGWFLLVKSLWMLGSGGDALCELDTALKILPGNPDLVLLQEQLQRDAEDNMSRFPQDENGCSRTVSPAFTPPAHSPASCSRAPTPPPIRRPAPPQQRSRRPSPEPPLEGHGGYGVTATFGAAALGPATFGAAPQTPPQCDLPGAVPRDGTPPPPTPLVRKSSANRMAAKMRQALPVRRSTRQESASPPPGTSRSCVGSFGLDQTETFGTPQMPCTAAPRRRPSPEPNSDGRWSCNRAPPAEVTATFGPARAPEACPRGASDLSKSCGPAFFAEAASASTPKTKTQGAFDGNRSCGAAFFTEALKASSPKVKPQGAFDGNRSCGPAFFAAAANAAQSRGPSVPGPLDFSHTFGSGSQPCTRPPSQRSHSLTSRYSEPPKPDAAVQAQSDGKSLREIILFGPRAYLKQKR